MLYAEFLKGTKAPELPETFDQYQLIEKIYTDCEGVTKEEAYRIWKNTYGKEIKSRELHQRERLDLLLNREDYDYVDRPHRAIIHQELYRFLAFPLVGEAHQRWAVIAKLNGSGRTGTMTGSNSCRVDGVAVTYSGSKIIPPRAASSGDRVAVIPCGTPDNVKYALAPIDYRLYTECDYYGREH